MSALPSVSSVPDSPELETLIRSLQVIGRQVRLAQGSLSQLLAVVAVELHFVPGTPATPQEIAAAFANQKTAENYWVVICGREPGLYTNSYVHPCPLPFHATLNLTQPGCQGPRPTAFPNQHQLRRSNFNDALAYYANNYPHNVKKLVERSRRPSAAAVCRSLRCAHRVAFRRARRVALRRARRVAFRVGRRSPSVRPPHWVDVVVVDDKTVSK
ncbi:hypothetical protein B0H14DRAFT_3507307 [Mycena olivaceomarginata]|nr:hypothetical protein B0H14DRAFT_3507307 [Mycena olivaceomarginata]